ncbi:MAG: PRC-barrel domain-containing protein [Chloroflexota bacterium]
MNASKLKDMPVVSMADGERVGYVKDFLFDTAKVQVVALVLTSASGEAILPLEAVRSIGDDAIMVEHAASTQGPTGQAPLVGLRGLDDLLSLQVVNSAGTLLGQVREVEIDPVGGRLVSLSVHRGGLLGVGGTTVRVEASAIRAIGPKAATVESLDAQT